VVFNFVLKGKGWSTSVDSDSFQTNSTAITSNISWSKWIMITWQNTDANFSRGHNKMKSSFAFGATYTIQRWRFLKTKWKHSDETRIANWKTQLGSKFFQHSQPVDVCCRPPPPTSMVSGRYLSSPTSKNKTISLHFMTLMLG